MGRTQRVSRQPAPQKWPHHSLTTPTVLLTDAVYSLELSHSLPYHHTDNIHTVMHGASIQALRSTDEPAVAISAHCTKPSTIGAPAEKRQRVCSRR